MCVFDVLYWFRFKDLLCRETLQGSSEGDASVSVREGGARGGV